MSKTVLVNVVEKKNPSKRTEPGKYYASLITGGEKNIEELAEEIEASCTVTSQDIVAVIEALRKRIIIGLQNGEIMRLGNIGYLRLSLLSKGAETKEGFSVANITRARILFTPCVSLKKMLKTLSYEVQRAGSGTDGSGNTETGGGTDGGDTEAGA